MKTQINEFLMEEAKKEKRKKIILILGISLIAFMNIIGQTVNNSIVVFSEGGEKITLILNGLRQNSIPETNVKASGLNQGNYKAKVIFDQKGLPDCDKTIPMMWAAEPVNNTEFVFSIAKDKKGNYKWKFVSQGPVAQSTYVSSSNTSATTVNTMNTNSNVNAAANSNPDNVNMNVNTTVADNAQSTTQVSTNTTNSTAGGTSGININMGVNGTGVNFGVNVNDGTGGTNGTTTTTTTSYTTTSVTSNGVTTGTSGSNAQVSTGINGNVGMNVQVSGTGSATNTNSYTSSNTSTVNNNSPATGGTVCSIPMSTPEFSDAKKSISDKSFEDTKLTLAKQVAGSNCLSADQVKAIMELFSFEESKLEFAKYCYSNCYDKKNYYKINDAFTFEASTNELNEYVKKR